jgi:hypothetical protein
MISKLITLWVSILHSIRKHSRHVNTYNGKGPHEAVSPEKQLLVCLSYLASTTSMRETGHIYRVCLSCDTGEVENEYHFFSTCPHYISLRKTFLQKVNIKIVNSNISLRHMSLLFNSSLPVTLKNYSQFFKWLFLNEKGHLETAVAILI